MKISTQHTKQLYQDARMVLGNINHYGMCDNTDCQQIGIRSLKKVYFKTEFQQYNDETAWWCRECIERDKDMLLSE